MTGLRRRKLVQIISAGVVSGVAGCERLPIGGSRLDLNSKAVLSDSPSQREKFLPEGAAENSLLGFSVAISGDRALIGAPWHDEDRGAAYIYHRGTDGWTLERELTPTPGEIGDYFGISVALTDDLAVIGAPRHARSTSGDGGSVYVYRDGNDGWTREAKLSPAEATPMDRFGHHSLLIDGSTIFIGAVNEEGPDGDPPGSVFVYRNDGDEWVETHRITLDADRPDGWFGAGLTTADNGVIVGCPTREASDTGDPGGRAYVFRDTDEGWTRVEEPTAEDARPDFGWSIASSNDTLLVGQVDSPAIVLERDGEGWREAAELRPETMDDRSRFGLSVALVDDTAIVGAPGDIGSDDLIGKTYVFSRDDGGWSQQAELTAQDGVRGDQFGSAVDLGERGALIGAVEAEDEDGTTTGAGYLFE